MVSLLSSVSCLPATRGIDMYLWVHSQGLFPASSSGGRGEQPGPGGIGLGTPNWREKEDDHATKPAVCLYVDRASRGDSYYRYLSSDPLPGLCPGAGAG